MSWLEDKLCDLINATADKICEGIEAVEKKVDRLDEVTDHFFDKLSEKDGFTAPLTEADIKRKKENPDFIDKWEMMWKDPKIEGKKWGYTRAAYKFKPEVEKIRNEITEILNRYSENKAASLEMAEEIDALRERKQFLESRLNNRAEALSKESGIGVSDILTGLDNSCNIANGTVLVPGADLFSLIYSGKRKALLKSEEEGYNEAKAIFEEEIALLKQEMEEKREKLVPATDKIAHVMEKMIDDIIELRVKIVELEALM